MAASRFRRSALIALSIVLASAATLNAQPLRPPAGAAAADDAAVPGSELTVYLMTMGPGDEVWEKFGHNAIWIHDSLRHTDVAYNWGLFDFAASDFFPRFLKGNMRYWMGGFDAGATIDFYRQANRSVIVQELNLSPAQRASLARFVEVNALPENRYYNYDYFRDNCSTRVRDALDAALGGVIRRASSGVASGTTYRFHTRRLTQDDPWVYFGTLLGLGHPVDREISRWEEMFLPVKFHDDIRGIRIKDSSGASVPLVKSDTVLFASTRPPERPEPSSHVPVYIVAGMLVAFVTLMLRHLSEGGENSRRTGLVVVAGLWHLAVGIGGAALAALWLFTNHVYSYYNENLFQANPLSLALAVMIFASVRKRGASESGAGIVGLRTEKMAMVIAALSVAGFVLQILPAFNQVNGEIIGLMLPAHIGVALALRRRVPWRTGTGELEPVTQS